MSIPDKYLNKDIYKKAKKEVDERHKKHSAYKSMDLIKTYKSMGGKFKNEKNGGTSTWRDEKWKNLSGVAQGKMSIKEAPPCGQRYKGQKKGTPSICRPTVKINNDTPSPLAQSYTKNQLKKALNIKKKGKTIQWDKL